MPVGVADAVRPRRARGGGPARRAGARAGGGVRRTRVRGRRRHARPLDGRPAGDAPRHRGGARRRRRAAGRRPVPSPALRGAGRSRARRRARAAARGRASLRSLLERAPHRRHRRGDVDARSIRRAARCSTSTSPADLASRTGPPSRVVAVPHDPFRIGDVEVLTVCEGLGAARRSLRRLAGQARRLGGRAGGPPVGVRRRRHSGRGTCTRSCCGRPTGDVLVDTGVGVFGPYRPVGRRGRVRRVGGGRCRARAPCRADAPARGSRRRSRFGCGVTTIPERPVSRCIPPTGSTSARRRTGGATPRGWFWMASRLTGRCRSSPTIMR